MIICMCLFVLIGPALLVDVPRDKNITGMFIFSQLFWFKYSVGF